MLKINTKIVHYIRYNLLYPCKWYVYLPKYSSSVVV